MNCIICHKKAEIHHVKTRKAYPEYIDENWNHMLLCREHHTLIHMKGLNFMAQNYNAIRAFLIFNCWQFDDYSKKWLPPRFE
jgi:hypothetical protein